MWSIWSLWSLWSLWSIFDNFYHFKYFDQFDEFEHFDHYGYIAYFGQFDEFNRFHFFGHFHSQKDKLIKRHFDHLQHFIPSNKWLPKTFNCKICLNYKTFWTSKIKWYQYLLTQQIWISNNFLASEILWILKIFQPQKTYAAMHKFCSCLQNVSSFY